MISAIMGFIIFSAMAVYFIITSKNAYVLYKQKNNPWNETWAFIYACFVIGFMAASFAFMYAIGI